MPQKKIIREPVEKLSSEAIIEITEDSSSDEEEDVPMIKKPAKKERTPAQIAATQKMLATRRRNKEAKMAKVADQSLDVSTHPVKEVAFEDDDDKPMTNRQMKVFMAQMNNSKPSPVKKPRKPRATKAERVVVETSAPPPTPKQAKPDMLFV
jgi:hypothetical protein|tara:strand:- start:109 stop:564 length:456 start_codon:yes stop_codon:yes gene_type:complete